MMLGLYRDDGLIVVENLSGQETNKLRKNIFKNVGFKI